MTSSVPCQVSLPWLDLYLSGYFGVSAVKPVQNCVGSGNQIGYLGTVATVSGKSWSDPSTDFEVEGHAV